MNFLQIISANFDSTTTARNLYEWRNRVLNGVLSSILSIWAFALILGFNNVYEIYFEDRLAYKANAVVAVSLIAIYLALTALLVAITLNRKFEYRLRAGLFLFILYTLGVIGLIVASLSGDGRIFLFAFIVFSSIFFNYRYGISALVICLLTLILVGWLQVSNIMVVPAENQINSTNISAWASGGFVLLGSGIAAMLSITYLLQALGRSLGESRESLDREQRLSRTLRTISNINQLIIREQDQNKLLSEACAHLISGRGYAFAWIGLLEADGVTLKLVASAGDTLDSDPFIVNLAAHEASYSCAAKAIQSRKYLQVHTSPEDDPCLVCPRRDKYPKRSAVSLPLLRDERVFGVLVVDHTLAAGLFDDEEVKLLQELADDLAYALGNLEANVRLQTYARHQSLLNEITKTALETPNMETMLKKFIEGLEKALNADGYYIALWDEAKQLPVQFISSYLLKDVFSVDPMISAGEKLFSKSILEHGRVLAVDDVMNTPYISPRLAALFQVHSAMGLPLIANSQKLGTLVLGFSEPHQFTSDEIELADLISRQVALAMLKARLDSATHERAVELGRLYAAAQDMASSIMDPPALLNKLAHHMVDALEATSGNIMAIDMFESSLQVVAEYWSDKALPEEISSDMGVVYPSKDFSTIVRTILAGETLVLHRDSENMTETETKQFLDYGIQSMLFVPIMAHGKLLGNIEIWESRRKRDFTLAEIRLSQAMAGHAASIIENSQLFAETRQRESELATMLSVSQAVSSSLELNQVLEQAAVSMARILHVDYCALSDYDPLDHAVRTIALYSADGDISEPQDIGFRFPLKDYPATMLVLESGNPLVIHIDDADADPAEVKTLHRDGAAVSLLLPLRVSGRSLGLVELCSSDLRREFKPEEIRLARALSDQVAVAIEKARLFETLEQREAYFRALIENSTEGVAILDSTGELRYVSPAEERLTGYRPEELYGTNAFRYIHPEDLSNLLTIFAENLATPGLTRTVEYRGQRKDGEWRYFELTGHNMLDDPHLRGIVVNYRDITERKQAEQALRENQFRLEAIITTALNGIITIDSEYRIVLFNPSAERIFGCSAIQAIGQRLEIFIPERYRHSHDDHVRSYSETGISNRRKGLLDSLFGLRANGEEFPMEAFISQSDIDEQTYFTVIFQDITERRQAEDALKASETKFRALAENIPSVVYICRNDERYSMIYLNDSIEKLTGYPKEEFLENGLSFFDLYHPDDLPHIPSSATTNIFLANQGSFHLTYRILHKSGEWRWVDEWGVGVMDEKGIVQYLEGTMIDISDRKRAEEDLRRHAMELETLVAASSALRTAQDVTEMVPILARHALRAVNSSYASIFLLDPETSEFVSRGWYAVDTPLNVTLPDESHIRHTLNEGITGHIAATGAIYVTEDLQKDPVVLILGGEEDRLKNVHGGISLPLRNQEKIIGVMHIWSLQPRIFSETEIRLLIALAETASNAIHRAILFEQTLQHASELALAYDNTLAGWARALELRDEITEGHTRRVTELTLKLARALGVPESEIVHIRRGALLHDIGKMGIPDSILHKPGAFTMQERFIMEQHTQYAYDMLESISYLQDALDIPYCHHEHWDGNGYPRKLKGEQIPLAARIFTVVDVWDALTSDRPYRPAWPKEKTRNYILERSGKQFDPRIVDAFFSLDL